MDEADGNIKNKIIFEYLCKNGYKNVAMKVKRLQGNKKVKCPPDRLVFAIVSNCLVNRGYENLAKKLAERKSFSNMNLLVKLYRKLSAPKISQKSDSKPHFYQRIPKNVSEVVKNPLPKEEFSEMNELVSITEMFRDKVRKLKGTFKKSEMPKVMDFIIESGFKVKKSIQQTLHLTSYELRYKTRLKVDKKFPFLKWGKLSGLRYGDNAEESLILKQWENLVNEVPINVPEKFLLDIEKYCPRWTRNLLGAYLSQNLNEHHRSAVQIFRALIGLKKRKGTFKPEEDELILELIANKASFGKWNRLAMKLGRSYLVLRHRRNYLKHYFVQNSKSAGAKFTLDEDRKILEHLNQRFDISSINSLKSIVSKDLYPLAQVITRGEKAIVGRWNYTLVPLILPYLYGAREIEWQREFLRYICEQKVKAICSVNWTYVLQRWPHQTKYSMTKVIGQVTSSERNLKAPLYQLVSNYLSKPKKNTPKSTQDRRRAILEIYDEIRTRNISKE